MPSPSSATNGGDETHGKGNPARAELITQVHRARPEWKPAAIGAAIDAALAAGRPLEHIAAVLPKLAADPDTGAPGRLTAPHGLWPDPPAAPKVYERSVADAHAVARPEGVPDPAAIRPTAPPELREALEPLRGRGTNVNYLTRPRHTTVTRERAAELARLAREHGTPVTPAPLLTAEPEFCGRCQELTPYCTCPAPPDAEPSGGTTP
ncbi:hypothetical protein F8568_036795 [Actinomadura sp. LD22]|uniref:Uncharacterized protein n=1 Tax=Actinomadura physcomitrii TaxID=2650748 RepID=A0A6I4MR40_9ACTN|nr:hypothetical protein [Actinomadura physcomitrii]MWA05821.1 hypothetical protein [Actinomadura physcomitrii]